MRIGAMHTLKLEDLEKIGDIYKIINTHEIKKNILLFARLTVPKK